LERNLYTISSHLPYVTDALTVVPVFNLVKSNVVPAGTVMSLITIAAQLAFPAIAAAASENVQPARASRLAGAAATSAPAPSKRDEVRIATMMSVENEVDAT
jgi:hypothetical protein